MFALRQTCGCMRHVRLDDQTLRSALDPNAGYRDNHSFTISTLVA